MSHNNDETRSDPAGAFWRAGSRLTIVLLVVWAAVSFLPAWFADELNRAIFFGWPLGFYMVAQGAPICFLLIVWLYDRWMTRLERHSGLDGDD